MNSFSVWACAMEPGPTATAGVPREEKMAASQNHAAPAGRPPASINLPTSGWEGSVSSASDPAMRLTARPGQAFENGLRPAVLPLRGEQTQIDHRLGVVGHDVEFRSAADRADAEGRATEDGILDGGERRGQSFLQGEQSRGEFDDRVLAAFGARTVGRASRRGDPRGHIDFVFVDDVQIRGFAHHDKSKLLFRGQCLGAVLPGLLSHQPGEPDFVGEARQKIAALVQGPKHGGHRSLGVAGPAAVDFPVAQIPAERIDGHAGHAHRVRMRGEEQTRFARGGKEPDHIGASGVDRTQPRLRPERAEEFRDELRASLFAGAVGAGVAVGIDAGNADQRLRQFHDGGGCRGHAVAERNHSTNFGTPSAILVRGL